jgi:hypothetical protein
MPPEIARTLFAASTSDKRDLMIVEGEETKIHGHAYQAEREMYINRVAGFLSAALQ